MVVQKIRKTLVAKTISGIFYFKQLQIEILKCRGRPLSESFLRIQIGLVGLCGRATQIFVNKKKKKSVI